MNIITFKQNFLTAKFFAVFTIVSLVLSAFPVAFNTAEAIGVAPQPKVDICHVLGEVEILNVAAASVPGHMVHGDFVINGPEDLERCLALIAPDPITGTISGVKFEDVDNDGAAQEDDESELSDWTIRLYEVGDPWVLVDTDLTDVNGEYEFSDVPEGSYKVCEVMKPDWTQTFISNGSTNLSPNASEEGPLCQTVNIDKEDESNTVNFGNYYEEIIPPVVYGCMDPLASNYNPLATEPGDELCEYPPKQCRNLLANGSFEEPVVTNASLWQKFAIVPGWVVMKVSDDSATTLELHRGIFNNTAADGEQYVELDGDHSTKITQTVPVLNGGLYELSWAFAARHNIAAEQNHLSVRVDGVEVETAGPATGAAGLSVGDWVSDSYQFVANGASADITFADIGPSNSYGTYLDDAELCLVREPEPEPVDPTLVITSPATDGTTLSGVYTFEAEYVDDDEVVDHINWAIRAGTCAANTGTVAGNVDGFSDPWSFVGIDFSTTIDMTTWDAGEYCLVVNPNEGDGIDLRETRTFFIEEAPDYAPYCGDGDINQSWEQCEIGDEGCTDYCTLANQCSSLPLVKITLDPEAPESTSFDGSLRLGSAGNIIPNGTWFNFAELGDSAVTATANAAEGLAIQRTPTDLRLAVKGGNSRTGFDYAFGNIETKGIALGPVNRAPIPGWPLENSGSYVDIFDKNSEEGVDFKFWLTTGDDAVAVAVGPGEEYDCDDCAAEVEARVVIRDEQGAEIANNGTGNLLPQVILGDGTSVPFGEWFKVSEAATSGASAVWIDDAETVTNFTNPGDLEGLFVSREGNGQLKVALYGNHSPGGDTNYESLRATIEFSDAKIVSGSTTQLPGDYKLENHSEADAVVSNDNFDSFTESGSLTSVDFDFWVDTKSDGITITLDPKEVAVCDDDTTPGDPKVELYRIDGHKYQVNGTGTVPVSGWTIYATNARTETVLSTTTNEHGEFWFTDLVPGVWDVSEEIPTNWMQVEVRQDGEIVDTASSTEHCTFVVPSESDYTCDFYNEFDDGGGNGPENPPTDPESEDEEDGRSSFSSGTRISRATPQPLVLGAATSQCGRLINDYMKVGQPNSEYEVTLLQFFLNGQGWFIPVTGVFDAATDQAVRAFQAEYRDEVLDPWLQAGYVAHNNPTGWVYQLTRWKINNIVCPGSEPLPVLIP